MKKLVLLLFVMMSCSLQVSDSCCMYYQGERIYPQRGPKVRDPRYPLRATRLEIMAAMIKAIKNLPRIITAVCSPTPG